jgi:hypothetical protein
MSKESQSPKQGGKKTSHYLPLAANQSGFNTKAIDVSIQAPLLNDNPRLPLHELSILGHCIRRV